jgi:hypothetical protein
MPDPENRSSCLSDTSKLSRANPGAPHARADHRASRPVAATPVAEPPVVRRERPAKGGHVIIRHGGRTTTVSMHRGDMPVGTFRAILRQLGLFNADLEQ